MPLAFVSNGGYDQTAGVAALTRLGDVGTFERIARPERFDPNKAATFHTPATAARIQATLQARAQAAMKRPMAPRAHANLATLHGLRAGDNELAKLVAALPEDLESGLKRQAQLAVAGFKSGLVRAAQLVRGGFDTHGDHDARHAPRMAELIGGVDFLWQEAERQGVADKLVVVVGSDFGRTPRYNSGQGKDHWSVTSMLLMGAGIPGGRVVGGTTHRQKPLKVHPKTLALDDNGVRITPGAVHRALRQLAGVEGSELAARFPIADAPLPLFG